MLDFIGDALPVSIDKKGFNEILESREVKVSFSDAINSEHFDSSVALAIVKNCKIHPAISGSNNVDSSG
jgi:hypothetical protein